MPLFKGKQNMGRNIATEMAAGKPRAQSIAIALSVARRKGKAEGGPVAEPQRGGIMDALAMVSQYLRGSYAEGGATKKKPEPSAPPPIMPEAYDRYENPLLPLMRTYGGAFGAGVVDPMGVPSWALTQIPEKYSPVSGANADWYKRRMQEARDESPTAAGAGSAVLPALLAGPLVGGPLLGAGSTAEAMTVMPPIMGIGAAGGRIKNAIDDMSRHPDRKRRPQAAYPPEGAYAEGGPVQGYAPGGWIGEEYTPSAMTEDILPARPKSPVPDFLLQQLAEARNAESPLHGQEFPAGIFAPAMTMAEMTGVPSMVRGASALREGQKTGDTPKMIEGGIEAGLGALPVAGRAYHGLKTLGSAAKPYVLPAMAGMGALGSGSAAQAPGETSPEEKLKGLYSDLAAAQARRQAAETRMNIEAPPGSPPSKKGERWSAAKQDADRAAAEIEGLRPLIQRVEAQNSPEAKLEAEKQKKKFEEDQRLKMANTSLRETHPEATWAAPVAGAMAGAYFGSKIKSGAVGKFNTKIDDLLARWAPAVEKAQRGDAAAAVEAQELGKQFAALQKAGPGGTGKALTAGAASGEVATFLPDEIDLARSIPGSQLQQNVFKPYQDDPLLFPKRLAVGALTGAGPAEIAALMAGRNASSPLGFGAATKAISDAGPKGAPPTPMSLRPAPESRPALLTGPESSPQVRLSSPEASELAPGRLVDKMDAGRSAVAPALSDVRPDAVEKALNLTKARQLPAPEALPSPAASAAPVRPAWASDPPPGVKLKKGYHWDGTQNQPRHETGTYGEMPKYSAPKVTKSDVGKVKPNGKGHSSDLEEIAPGIPKKPVREPGADDPGFRKYGGAVAGALRTVAKYATGGKVGGPLKSNAGGRTDVIPTSVQSGSYILPADYVNSIGEDSSAHGHRVWQAMQDKVVSDFYGANAQVAKKQMAAGGNATNKVPIMAAGDEHVVPPEVVKAFGRGSMEAGHERLNKMVMEERQRHIRRLASLPPPAK